MSTIRVMKNNERQFEDTKGVIRSRKSKDRQHNGQKDKQRYSKYYRKLKIEEHEPMLCTLIVYVLLIYHIHVMYIKFICIMYYLYIIYMLCALRL
jgi:hypothetical protein